MIGDDQSTVRVLDLTQGALSLAGNMLAKLGQDVIVVEPPAALAPRRTSAVAWSAFGSGKRGVTCDLTTEAGAALFGRLAATADVAIAGDDLSGVPVPAVDWGALMAVNPRLIVVLVTPFGATGVKSGYAASDLILWAAGGPLYLSRDGDRAPLRISSDQALLHAAADAALGAQVALAAREKTGRGQTVTVAAVQSVTQATLSASLAAAVGHEGYTIMNPAKKMARREKKQLDLSGSGARTRRSMWQVKDGLVELHMALGPASGRFTNNLFGWLHSIGACQERFAQWDWAKQVPVMYEAGDVGEDDLEQARGDIAAAFARFTKEELLRIALKHKLLLAPIMTIADLAGSDQLNARRVFVDVAEGGAVRRIPSGVTGHAATSPLRGAPTVGEHNAEVYGVLGLSDTELDGLRQEGII